tara:strand:- start:72 stop:737 length:666 start_codon:yes stop_codon:yes gene_type:complete
MNTRLKTFFWVFYYCSLGYFLYYLEWYDSYSRPGFWGYFLILVILIAIWFTLAIVNDDVALYSKSTDNWVLGLFLVYFPAVYYVSNYYFYNYLLISTFWAAGGVVVLFFLITIFHEDFLPWAKPFFESKEEKEMKRKQHEEEVERERNWREIERKNRERTFLEVEVPKLKEELEFLNNKLENLEEQAIYINYDPQQKAALRDEKHLVVVRIAEISRILDTN